MKFKIKCKKEVFALYQPNYYLVLNTKVTGLILDFIIPFTFGIITYVLLKVFGDSLKIPKPKGLYTIFPFLNLSQKKAIC